MATYDYPFNERIRTLLRVEDLFAQVIRNVKSTEKQQHHNALVTLLQMLDVVDRAELKADLLQELDRQLIAMKMLLGNPSIAEGKLDKIMADINIAAAGLRAETTKLGQTLRANEWLMSIKQRAGIPGGLCAFDLPSYHYWLGLPLAKRKSDFDTWLQPLMPMYNAVNIILQILRGTGTTHKFTATNGSYQQMLAGAKPAQLLRLEMDSSIECFPEVSANKYAINIRFNNLECTERPKKCEQDVKFALTLCNL